jgi:hypothetical protein
MSARLRFLYSTGASTLRKNKSQRRAVFLAEPSEGQQAWPRRDIFIERHIHRQPTHVAFEFDFWKKEDPGRQALGSLQTNSKLTKTL